MVCEGGKEGGRKGGREREKRGLRMREGHPFLVRVLARLLMQNRTGDGGREEGGTGER